MLSAVCANSFIKDELLLQFFGSNSYATNNPVQQAPQSLSSQTKTVAKDEYEKTYKGVENKCRNKVST